MEDLEDALGLEQRTSRVRAEIERRRRFQGLVGDELLVDEFGIPIDPQSLDLWQLNDEQLLQHQLLQTNTLDRRRRLLSTLRGTQSLAEDILPPEMMSNQPYLISEGHHTNEYLTRNRPPLLNKGIQSRSLDLPFNNPYVYAPPHPSSLVPLPPPTHSNMMPSVYMEPTGYSNQLNGNYLFFNFVYIYFYLN